MVRTDGRADSWLAKFLGCMDSQIFLLSFFLSFWVENSTSLLYFPIPSSAETWKILTNMLRNFFFHLSWHFKREKSGFWKSSFLQNKYWLRVQEFLYKIRISFLIGAITKRFFSGKLIYKSNRKRFPCICIVWY